MYCACCLGKITIDGLNSDDVAAIRPYFYVNVADIDVIAKEKTYIACGFDFRFCFCCSDAR